MKFKKTIVTFITGLLLSACSGGDGLMDDIMASWEGATVDQAIDQWGYPTAQQSIAGRTLLIWSETQFLTMPTTINTTGQASTIGSQVFVNSMSTVSGGGTSSWTCERILEVSPTNTIVRGSWRGNNCPFMEAGKYSNWRRASAAQ